MKTSLLIGSTLLLAASALIAQTPTTPQAQPSSKMVLTLAAPGEGCPVSMRALHGSGHGMIAVKNQPPVDGFAQEIHLILGNRQAAKVVNAELVVQGYSGKQRLAQTLSGEADGDLTKTVDASFTPEDGAAAADLLLRGFTAVSSIRLESITYSDGSTWKVGGQQVCRVAPDPMMLIAAH
jgi:hypothetical protein